MTKADPPVPQWAQPVPTQPPAAQSDAVVWPSVEAVARKICLSYGSDPDELASILEICTADNKPLPRWRLYEEQAEAVAELYASPARSELLIAQECIARETTRCIRLEQTIRDTIEALEQNSTSAPVVECLKAALSSQGATREALTDQEIMTRIAELRAMLLRSSTVTKEPGCGTPGCTDPNCNYGTEDRPAYCATADAICHYPACTCTVSSADRGTP